MIALVTTAGWLLFMIFAGIGLVALPLDLIRELLGRPRSTISKTEYLAKAKGLGQRAKNIMVSSAWNLHMIHTTNCCCMCVLGRLQSTLLSSDMAGAEGVGQGAKGIIVPCCLTESFMYRWESRFWQLVGC